ncbi:uncharacterized protein PAC_12711 [Phialocephala subalpina]|uniref:Uncharacterized protein n=1 Tax=Phialocephala subalpina TaxID=576137 RepID=A0A1L7XCQ4_9HELO|nr:uncharacterized protein PAC_12711 [Phialocephala subalpina]
MPGIIPTYYLILSAANISVLTFAYGKLAAPAAAVARPALAAKRQRMVSKLNFERAREREFRKATHAYFLARK